MLQEVFAREAESLVGTRFVVHGRDPQIGLDCAGLVICAAKRAGLDVTDIEYTLSAHSDHFHAMEELLEKDCTQVGGDWQRGDILALRYPPMYNHLAVYLGSDRMVHAYDHRAVRHVLITSMDPALKRRVKSVWRLDRAI